MFRIRLLETIAVDVLKAINGMVGNYGIAIIIVTILMRILILPLTLKQEQSMKKMREFQPEIDKLKEKYKDDQKKQQEEMMKLYRENNINPMGGCLPILIQMPIFVALYYAFSGSAIPQNATFLWFNLKQPDQFYRIGGFFINLLPILNTAVTYIQQKIMADATKGQEVNNTMQSMLYTMPIMMLVIFYNMPSGVTLYYLVSGVLSVIQQYFILKGRN